MYCAKTKQGYILYQTIGNYDQHMLWRKHYTTKQEKKIRE